MDEMQSCNRAVLCGTPLAEPVFSHESRDERFYLFPLEVARLSGTVDRLNVVLRQEMLPLIRPNRAGLLRLDGELRSFNNRSGVGNRLVITLFAREISQPETSVWINEAELIGTICKQPTHRMTPLGREICDLLLAVHRRYSRSDYLPCIVWGQNARRAASFAVGDQVHLFGRMQSREYVKVSEGRSEVHTAYEVSVSDIELL